jgi:hypothetical protein
VPESAQCQFRGFDAASESWSAFQRETTKACLRQIPGGEHAVVVRSGNDNIETIGSSGLSLEIESVESESREGRSFYKSTPRYWSQVTYPFHPRCKGIPCNLNSPAAKSGTPSKPWAHHAPYDI